MHRATNVGPGSPDHPGGHIPGEAGMWVFLFGDLLLFVVYFANYLLSRIKDPALFVSGQIELNQTYGALNTLVLLTSSLFVFAGLRAIRQSLKSPSRLMFAGAVICAFAFCGLKLFEWSEKFERGITPFTNTFFLYYYTLTGLHLVHVILGIGVLLYLFSQTRRADHTPGKMMLIEGGACWWHMIDIIWMILFPVIYLAR